MTELDERNSGVTELSALLIPVGERQLIVPNVAVAEIVASAAVDSLADQTDWLLGFIDWRSERIPLICFERLNGRTPEQGHAPDRIAVFNGIVDSEKLPFCAMVTAGVPRQMRIDAEVINPIEAETAAAELGWVLVNGEQAVIPDLDYLQQQLLQTL